MKHKIICGTAILFIAVVVVMNVNLGLKSNKLSGVSLTNVEALAEEGNSAQNCPGGYCSYSNSFGESCSACCPPGKNPKCNSSGCGCEGC
jgi:hypothetical protein